MNDCNYKKLASRPAASSDESEAGVHPAKRIKSDNFASVPYPDHSSNVHNGRPEKQTAGSSVVAEVPNAENTNASKQNLASPPESKQVERPLSVNNELATRLYDQSPEDEEDQDEDCGEAIGDDGSGDRHDSDVVERNDSDIAARSDGDISDSIGSKSSVRDVPTVPAIDFSDEEHDAEDDNITDENNHSTTNLSPDSAILDIETNDNEDDDFIEDESDQQECYSDSSLHEEDQEDLSQYYDDEEAFDHNLPNLGVCGICAGDMYRVTVLQRCDHSFCNECFRIWAYEVRDKMKGVVACPECRVEALEWM